MRILKGLLLSFLMGTAGAASAQDIHFTMFDMAPINLNPVYTGYYSGTFRIGGIYRSQWQGLGVNSPDGASNFSGYKTPSAYADIALGIPPKTGAEMKSWLGVGLNFYNDQANSLSTMRAELALAYHLGLGARGRTRLSLGVKGGIYQNRHKQTDYSWGEELNGNTDPDDAPTAWGAESSASAPDFSAGLMLAHRGTGWGLEVAGSFNHFTQPELNIGTSPSAYKLPSNVIASVRTNFSLGNNFSVRPMVFMQLMTNVLELNAQAVFAYHFVPTKDVNLLFGGGYRLNDAAFARLGFEYKGLIIGAAYDFNLSSLNLNNNAGYSGTNARAMGFEFGLSYIAKIYKEMVVKEILYNPRF
jgi:type IX secretion system PorP/SprF family membrane protein